MSSLWVFILLLPRSSIQLVNKWVSQSAPRVLKLLVATLSLLGSPHSYQHHHHHHQRRRRRWHMWMGRKKKTVDLKWVGVFTGQRLVHKINTQQSVEYIFYTISGRLPVRVDRVCMGTCLLDKAPQYITCNREGSESKWESKAPPYQLGRVTEEATHTNNLIPPPCNPVFCGCLTMG